MIHTKNYIPTLNNRYYKTPLNLDITYRCPLLCPGCIRQTERQIKYKGVYEEMTIEDFKKIIKLFPYIEFCGQQSDPLTHPKFIEFLKLSKDLQVDVHTATSHKKRNFYYDAFMANPNAKWIFGLDGLPEESHKYRINQDGKKLFRMMRLGVSLGIEVVWQYIIFNYNQNHIEQAEMMATEEGIEFSLAKSSRWGDIMASYKPKEEYCV